MNNEYLIPANSKKSMLILGIFNKFDCYLAGAGVALTLIFLLIFDSEKFINVIIIFSPVAISAFLLFPIPNYHNLITVFGNIYNYFTTNQRLVWKGWCANGKENK